MTTKSHDERALELRDMVLRHTAEDCATDADDTRCEAVQEISAALLAAEREGRVEAFEEAAAAAGKMQRAAASVLAERHDKDAAVQHDTAAEIAAEIRQLALDAEQKAGR